MIKATMSNGGILLGLSSENLKRLQEGMPIMIEAGNGWPMPVLICYGDTEEDLLEALAPIIDPSTKITGDPPNAH